MISVQSEREVVQVVHEIKAFEPSRRIHRSIIARVQLPWYMVSTRSVGKYRWDIFILAAALYNCIASPYLGTFEPPSSDSLGFTLTGVLIDLVFIGDLVLSFFTTYIEEYGREVTDLKRIRDKYLQGKFIIDAVAALPIEIITAVFLQRGTVLYVLGFLRILRLSRLGKIFFYLRVNVEVKITLRMMQLVGFLLVYIHMMACSWYFLVKQDKSWEVAVYTVYKEGSVYEEDQLTQYWLIYYVGLYTLLGVEIYPTTLSEYVFMSVAVLIGALIMSVILGDMVVLITAISQDTKRYNIHYDKLNEVMKNLQLPSQLQNEVVAFYVASFYSLKENLDYRKLLGYLTRGLQQKVIQSTYRSFFSTNIILQQNAEAWKFIILAFKDVFFKPDESIIDQFSYGREMSFIIKGKCLVSVLDEIEAVHAVRELGEGDFFGEVALLFNTSRTASVSSKAYTYTLQLSERYFHYFCQQNPEWRQSLVQKCAMYDDPHRRYMFSLLQRIPYFNGLSAVDAQHVLYAGRLQFYNTNTYLFERQQVADRVFIVLSGTVSILFPLKRMPSIMQAWRHSSSATAPSVPGRQLPRRLFKLEIESLGSGSVISPIKTLVQHQNIVDCKAANHVVVLEYSWNKLNALAEKLTPLRIKINKTRAKHMYFDKYRNDYISHLIPMDYCKYLSDDVDFLQWQRWALFKEEVLRKIIYQRIQRKVFKVNWKHFIRKVRATVKAEKEGFPQIAAKIASAEVHPDISESLEFVGPKEAENPLILQFAIEMMHITHAERQEEEDLRYLTTKFVSNSGLLHDVRLELKMLKQLLELYMSYL